MYLILFNQSRPETLYLNLKCFLIHARCTWFHLTNHVQRFWTWIWGQNGCLNLMLTSTLLFLLGSTIFCYLRFFVRDCSKLLFISKWRIQFNMLFLLLLNLRRLQSSLLIENGSNWTLSKKYLFWAKSSRNSVGSLLDFIAWVGVIFFVSSPIKEWSEVDSVLSLITLKTPSKFSLNFSVKWICVSGNLHLC